MRSQEIPFSRITSVKSASSSGRAIPQSPQPAEMLPGSLSGVGYLITHAYTVGRTDVVIAGMISIGLVGAVLDRIFRLYEDRKFVWKRLTK